jgi:CheY-like chemotaxis protein/DNA-directed RNA polymerase subunit RPC12/RpoP
MPQRPIEGTLLTGSQIRRRKEGPASPSSRYVLVVDDEAVVRSFLARCIEGLGYVTKQAASAAEALEIMVAEPAALVLCDIKMPGQDGLWLAERLHTHWPATAIVMATAIDDVETVRQSRSLGAVDYVSKPVKPEQLHEIVRRLMAPAEEEARDTEHEADSPRELASMQDTRIEAEYTLETPVRCPACGERITTLKAVRLIRAQVNFTSTLPRRGRVLACPHCLSMIPAELTNF